MKNRQMLPKLLLRLLFGLMVLGVLPVFAQSIRWAQIRDPHLLGGLYAARPTCNSSRNAWLYVAIDQPSGSNTYACLPPTWILQAGGGSGSGNVIGPGANTNNQVTLWTGTLNTIKTGPLLLGAGVDIPTIGSGFQPRNCAVAQADGTLSIDGSQITSLPTNCVFYNGGSVLPTGGGLVQWSSAGSLSGGPFLDNGPITSVTPTANALPKADSGAKISPAWIGTLTTCGDATHALGYAPGVPGFICQAITGSASAGGADTQIQFNSTSALGGITKWTTNGTTTVNGIATAILDLHLGASIFLPGGLSTGIVRVTTSTGAIIGSELSGDGTTSGSNVLTNLRINGTTVPVNSAADQILITTASATGAWKVFTDCSGANQAVTYSTTTHSLGCNTIAGSGTINTGTGLAFYPSSGTTISGMGADFIFASVPHTIQSGSLGILDLSASPVSSGHKLPTGASASPTSSGVIAFDSTNLNLVWGNGTTTNHATFVNGVALAAGVGIFSGTGYGLTSLPLRGTGTEIPTINGTSGFLNCAIALAGGTLSTSGNTVGGFPTACVRYDPLISITPGGLVQWSSSISGPFLDNGPLFSVTPAANKLVQASGAGTISASWLPGTIASNTTGSAASLTGYGFSGTGLTLGTTSGALVIGDCLKVVANGNIGDAGAPCGTSVQFGSVCNSTITSTLGQTSIASGCSLGSSIIQVFLDGLILQAGSGNDYSISGNNILMDGTSYPAGLVAGQKIRIIQ